ncbi:hypothetical protein [Nocardiopsis sp. NPDC055824]
MEQDLDRREAAEILDHADAVGRRIRGRARWTALTVTGLGALMVCAVLVVGLAPVGPAPRAVAYATAVLTLIAMNWYAYSRPVALRRHLTVHYVLTGAGVLLLTVTVSMGLTVFTGSVVWWSVGAALNGLPFLAAVLVNLVGVRRATR